MRPVKLTCLLVIGLALVIGGCAGVQPRLPGYESVSIPELEWMPPDYSEFSLDNGMSGLVIHDTEVPLVNIYFSFPEPVDPADKVGLAEMGAWLLRNGGSENISADSLNNLIEFKGMVLNIGADEELLYMSVLCLKNDVDLVMGVMRELIEHPAYPPQMVEFKRRQMLESIRRSNDEPYRICVREISKLIYKDHPLGRSNTAVTVNAVTRDDLLNFHRKAFQPSGAVMGVSGDITVQEAKALAGKHFQSLKGITAKLAEMAPTCESAEPGVYYAYKDVNQAYVMMGHQSIRYDDTRRHAADLMNYILGGGGFQSIMMTEVRINEGLAYGVGSRFTAPVPAVGVFRAGASTRLEEAGRTLNVMEKVIRDYQQSGPTEEQFEAAKMAYINSFVWDFERTEEVLWRLVYYKWRGLPLDTPQRDLEAYQNVTLEDVCQTARELLHPDSLIKVVIGDKSKMTQPLESFGKVTELNISVE